MTDKSVLKPEAGAAVQNCPAQLEALRKIAAQDTPEKEVRWKGRFPYTDTAYVIRALNNAFAFDWDFEQDNEEMILNPKNGRPFEVRVRGRLTVRLNGHAVIKVQFGSQPIEYLQKDPATPVSIGDAYKGAGSDALKKCASLLGVALDLYDSDSAIHRGPIHRGRNGRQQAVNRRPSIIAFAEDALKWTPEQLIEEIYSRLGIAIEPANLASAIESLPSPQLKELEQALKAELQATNAKWD